MADRKTRGEPRTELDSPTTKEVIVLQQSYNKNSQKSMHLENEAHRWRHAYIRWGERRFAVRPALTLNEIEEHPEVATEPRLAKIGAVDGG